MNMQKTFKSLKAWADKQPDFMDLDITKEEHDEIEDQEFKWGEPNLCCENCNKVIGDITQSYEDKFCSEDCYDEWERNEWDKADDKIKQDKIDRKY